MGIIFNPSLIELNANATTAEEAIEKAGQRLIDAQICSSNYVQAMLDVYHEYGAYIVLDTGIAMPHARPEMGAKATGFSILQLAQPVIFNHADFDPVQVIIAIASCDDNEHIQLIQLIATLIEKQIVSTVIQAKTKQEIVNIIQPLININEEVATC